jgi:RNA polymerase sigma-70 factor (sigma-E family)
MDPTTEQEFRVFVRDRSTALLRLAFLLTGGDEHAAEDLLQSALTRTIDRWARIENPEAYVRQAMYHLQVSRWRLKWPRREVQLAQVPDLPEGEVRDGADAVELRLVVQAALRMLTPRQRAVLVLRFFEDLPEAEVASILGIGVGTVRSTTHRSLARLRELAPELNDLRRVLS